MPGDDLALQRALNNALENSNIPEINRLLAIEGMEKKVGIQTLKEALQWGRMEVAKRLLQIPTVMAKSEEALLFAAESGLSSQVEFLLGYAEVKTRASLLKPKLLKAADRAIQNIDPQTSSYQRHHETVRRLERIPGTYRSLLYGMRLQATDEPLVRIEDPLLFRASKAGEKAFLLLGTDHGLSVNCFTDEVKTLLQQQTTLVIEKLKFTIAEMAPDILLMPQDVLFRNAADQNAWRSLSLRDQETVRTVLNDVQDQLVKQGKDISDLKDELLFGMFYGALRNDAGDHSMDVQLRDFYLKQNKQVLGLELPAELAPQLGEYSKLSEGKTPSEYYIATQAEASLTVKMYAQNGETLLGVPFVMPALAKRNEMWFPRIQEIIKNQDQTLIAVGAGHLSEYNAGMLKWLQEKGYTLEKADKNGKFNPYFYSQDPKSKTKPTN